MKETMVGVQELARKKGIIKETKVEMVIKANKLIGEIRELEEKSNELYRQERNKYMCRLKLSHTISRLRKEQERLWGLKPLQTHKEIDQELGIKQLR